MIVLIYAHPYPQHSRANRVLLQAVKDLPGLVVRSLYDLYPDFDIDVEAEQALLSECRGVVWQHPLYWYSVPGLLKHWFDKVLIRGFAYGDGGQALVDKHCLWAPTTGGDEIAFSGAGMHGHPLSTFSYPLEQTALFCGMRWHPPFVVHGAHKVSDRTLERTAASYREVIEGLLFESGRSPRVQSS